MWVLELGLMLDLESELGSSWFQVVAGCNLWMLWVLNKISMKLRVGGRLG